MLLCTSCVDKRNIQAPNNLENYEYTILCDQKPVTIKMPVDINSYIDKQHGSIFNLSQCAQDLGWKPDEEGYIYDASDFNVHFKLNISASDVEEKNLLMWVEYRFSLPDSDAPYYDFVSGGTDEHNDIVVSFHHDFQKSSDENSERIYIYDPGSEIYKLDSFDNVYVSYDCAVVLTYMLSWVQNNPNKNFMGESGSSFVYYSNVEDEPYVRDLYKADVYELP